MVRYTFDHPGFVCGYSDEWADTGSCDRGNRLVHLTIWFDVSMSGQVF